MPANKVMIKNRVQNRVLQRFPTRRRDSERRYNEFVKPVLKDLRAYASKMAGSNRELVDDLVQAASIKIIRNAGVYDEGRGSKGTFARTIAERKMINWMRDERRYRQRFLQELQDRPLSAIVASSEPEPGQRIPPIDRPNILLVVKRLINEANPTPKQREIFTYYTGLKDGRIKNYQEVADHFRIPMGTVKSTLHTMRERLLKEARKA